MKSTIWKYQLEIKDGIQELEIPRNSQFLSMQSQIGIPTLWFHINCNETEKIIRRFRVICTGEIFTYEPNDFLRFVGTMQTGPLVFHVFELTRIDKESIIR